MSRVARLSALARCYSTLSDQIPDLVKKSTVVVFMKGVPDQPRCGFSNAVVQILQAHSVKYEAFDVLSDEDLKEGIKGFSNWPTIPQVYINGDFVGGCDILYEMHKSGELVTALKEAGIVSSLADEKPSATKD